MNSKSNKIVVFMSVMCILLIFNSSDINSDDVVEEDNDNRNLENVKLAKNPTNVSVDFSSELPNIDGVVSLTEWADANKTFINF